MIILEETLIIKRIPQYRQNKSTEPKRAKNVFLLDNSLKSALIENFNSLDSHIDLVTMNITEVEQPS